MRIEFTREKVYVTGKPKEICQRVPTRRHRFKRGSGSCSFSPDEFYEFKHAQTHVLFIDMSLGQALLFDKETVMKAIVKTPYMGGFIMVAELMPAYLAGQYTLVGAKNG